MGLKSLVNNGFSDRWFQIEAAYFLFPPECRKLVGAGGFKRSIPSETSMPEEVSEGIDVSKGLAGEVSKGIGCFKRYEWYARIFMRHGRSIIVWLNQVQPHGLRAIRTASRQIGREWKIALAFLLILAYNAFCDNFGGRHEGISVSTGNFIQVERLGALGQQTRPRRQDSRRGAVWAVMGDTRECREARQPEER